MTTSDSAAPKRKREEEDDTSDLPRPQQIQRDILQVLQQHDTTPSLLDHALSSTDTHSPKKQRLSAPASDAASISAKLAKASYTSLQQLSKDATLVSEALVSNIRSQSSQPREGEGLSLSRPSVDELKQIHRIQTLETLVKDIVDNETRRDPPVSAPGTLKEENREMTNGHAAANSSAAVNSRAGTVLTLFGNAPTPKQLFSSMQNPATGRNDSWVKSELPVDEMPLPNGISATRIMSTPADDSQKGPTFEQTFAPPHNLATLHPPKALKRSGLRNNSITWEFKDPVQRNKKGGYTVQPLTVGDWLHYGNEDGEPVSPREKRKLRDRALSIGETTTHPEKVLSEEQLLKQEEALFRRAYSSFAPTHDNSNAVVPEEIKNMVWWHKVGSKRFNDSFAIDPALLDESEPIQPTWNEVEDAPLNEESFDQVLDVIDELEQVPYQEDHVSDKTQVDQALKEISELLETLASHQRIRNSTLPTTAAAIRTPISPAPIVAAKLGKPDEPSEEEQATYDSLRRELAYLILKLPPYAVAKLDGDQLSNLGVKQMMKFQSKNMKGTMEEDHVTRQAKLAAVTTAASIANLARPTSSSGQHYSTSGQRTPAIGQNANTRYGQQFGQRAAAPLQSFQRQTSNPSYGSPANVQRPAYAQSQYTRPNAPQPTYHQSNGQQYYQRQPPQTPNAYGYNQQYGQASLAQQRPTYPTQQGQQYQQRSHTAAANAVNYQTNTNVSQQAYNRTVSPAKSGYSAPMQQPGQQRALYQAPSQPQHPQPGSGRVTPVSYPSQPQTPVNGYQGPPPARPTSALAPRPSSSTPQPQQYQAPPPSSPAQGLVANGTS